MSEHTSPAVVVGLGQMGGVFSHALLRAGQTVVPWTRQSAPNLDSVNPSVVLVATGESDLAPAVRALPHAWRERVALLQNELVPSSWQTLELETPTVAVVWFEKKQHTPVHVIQPTPIAGPHAASLVRALQGLGIDAHETSHPDLVSDLVSKNLYIATANIAGLMLPPKTSVGVLWNDHRSLAETVAREALELQRALVSTELDEAPLLASLQSSFMADPEHGARGRSAPARLERAIALAKEHGVAVPQMRRIAEAIS